MIMAYFKRKGCVQRNLDLNYVLNEKVLKAIVISVISYGSSQVLVI